MLKAFIVDDEAPARSRLKKLLKSLEDSGEVQVAGEAGDGVEALKKLNDAEVDLVFLDIKMPELDGFGVLERLDPTARPSVVFTTAFDEYAIKAFDANAVDYLLKPITKDRLAEAVNRVKSARRAPDELKVDDERLAKLLDWIDAHEEFVDAPPPPPAGNVLKQISIPYRDRILIVPVDRLVSAEISEGITRLHVLEEPDGGPKRKLRQHIVSYTLEQLESNLSPEHFMRVHRSAIVQIDHITEMISWFSGRYKLVLTGGHEVIASRERSKQLKDRLMM
ncbi:MAG: response regulator [Rhodothermales bacterium]|nr:response regulator [Rhodothermales bacterium]